MHKVTNDLLKKIIKHGETYGFIKCIEKSGTCEQFKFGPAGELLNDSIRKEWIYSNVIFREKNVFMFNSGEERDLLSDIREGFIAAKTYANSELPFGLADGRKQSTIGESVERDVLQPRRHVSLRYFSIVGPHEAEQFFYRFQQQRKRWWRKFSTTDPGKFSFAEIEKQDGMLGETAKIVAEFPWGFHALETVKYHGSVPFQNLSNEDVNVFSVRNQKKRCLPHIIECELSLDYATLTYLCDAFTVKRGRTILKFHRKMAPFKFAFVADPTGITADECQHLFDAAEMMCLSIRKVGLSALLPFKTDFGKKKLQAQLLRSDSLGVPYTAVLKKETLNTGIFGLYSRDTTLQEEVHISKMTEYGELLMKNY